MKLVPALRTNLRGKGRDVVVMPRLEVGGDAEVDDLQGVVCPHKIYTYTDLR